MDNAGIETAQNRSLRNVVWSGRGTPTSDGAGVKLTRVIGTSALPDLDPFLMLDQFGSDDPDAYIAGFPEHPHRGFETVTYMLDGRMRHKDSVGNEGVLEPGSVQWMTAGRGILHSEMPEQKQGMMRGFQLWLNLPASDKMTEPRYQDIQAGELPTFSMPGVSGKVIAGSFAGAKSPVRTGWTDAFYLDVALDEGAKLEVPLKPDHNAFIFPFEGSIDVDGGSGGTKVASHSIAVLSRGDTVLLRGATGGGRMLLAAARPIEEPISRHGPFVMNTDAEIRQAFDDYRSGAFAAA